MTSFPCFGRAIALCMALVILIVSLPLGAAKAKLVATEHVITETSAVSERERIIGFLMRAEVRTQMRDWGVDATEAAARVAALSDDEVRHIAGQLDSLPAGQYAATVALIGLSLILFLIILEAFGAIEIFSFMEPEGPGPPR